MPPPPNVAAGSTSGMGVTPLADLTARSPATSFHLRHRSEVPADQPAGSASGTGRSSAGNSLDSNIVPPPPSVIGIGQRNGRKRLGKSADLATAASGGECNSSAARTRRRLRPVRLWQRQKRLRPRRSGRCRLSLSLLPKAAAETAIAREWCYPRNPATKSECPAAAAKARLRCLPPAETNPASAAPAEALASDTATARAVAWRAMAPVRASPVPAVAPILNARGGISPTPGPGGAGSAPTGDPAVPGVDVRGGSTTVVTLPSFGSDGGSSGASNLPGRSSVKRRERPGDHHRRHVALRRSFDFYGKLPGDNYSVYVDTTIGTVVMQFAEVNPSQPQAGALIGPQGLRTDLPAKSSARPRRDQMQARRLRQPERFAGARTRPRRNDGEDHARSAQLEVPSRHARRASRSKSMPSSASTSTPTTAIEAGRA